MNVFYLHSDPKKCAQYHNDSHVVKMQLESAQLLCSAHTLTGNDAPYKMSKGHMKHPSALWVQKSLSNYWWLCELGMELLEEHKYRFEKPADYVTKANDVIKWCVDNFPDIPDLGFTKPALAMPEKYRHDNVAIAYKTYYITDKQYYMRGDTKVWHTWRKRGEPFWWKSIKPL